ncbi:MAG: DsbA family protein [Pseudomonadota bacterium]|nr:DsbA family protein [Pseudomonadota bacterium]
MKMEMIMVATALGLAVAIGNSVDAAEPASTTGARAAESTTGAGEPAAALVDAIIRKMESSGALDAAVDRAINRYVQRKERARETDEKDRAKNARPIDMKQDHIRGNAAAEVSLIEYTDFECPFCKRFHNTPKPLLDRYGGRVNWVVRNYPLPFHDPAARKEAIAAECVAHLGGNDAYWKYADSVFANTKSNGGGLPADKSVEKLAEAVGIKTAALTQCMKDDATGKRVEQDIADGAAAGVSGTPTTVVRNNRTGASEAVVGALPATSLVPVIDRMLDAK